MNLRTVYLDVGGTNIRLLTIRARPEITCLNSRRHSRLCGNDGMSGDEGQLLNAFKNIFRSYPRQSLHLIAGLRGVWTPSEKNTWKKKLKSLAKKVEVFSDIELHHRLAFNGKPGILLNAGTGSIAFGISPSGKWSRAGGLGPLLGDEGSAFWIGREYLKRIHTNNWKVLRPVAISSDVVRRVATTAAAVLRNASRKKGFEREITIAAQIHLLQLFLTVKKELGWKKKAPLRLRGGLFENKWFLKTFLDLADRHAALD